MMVVRKDDIEMMMELSQITMSASMIVKKEERCIARCLDSLSEAVDEIIIVDTGSMEFNDIDYSTVS